MPKTWNIKIDNYIQANPNCIIATVLNPVIVRATDAGCWSKNLFVKLEIETEILRVVCMNRARCHLSRR
ncbi:hypothetical protein [Nostoc sp. CHAB 5715]|uniref:hypothetical protein n=1 Tax=Nostoc sp. CHAB 5715 TaxID=2780400 RepID=UPI001E3AF4B7|nr:hypothetical protein [Nostoc sp. CHAB 5715]MCC5621201.1 hypothetical protein [Nostoc sp. CHAB 5715]